MKLLYAIIDSTELMSLLNKSVNKNQLEAAAAAAAVLLYSLSLSRVLLCSQQRPESCSTAAEHCRKPSAGTVDNSASLWHVETGECVGLGPTSKTPTKACVHK